MTVRGSDRRGNGMMTVIDGTDREMIEGIQAGGMTEEEEGVAGTTEGQETMITEKGTIEGVGMVGIERIAIGTGEGHVVRRGTDIGSGCFYNTRHELNRSANCIRLTL